MAAGDRIFMAKESTSQEILSNTKKIIEDAKAKPKRYGMRINLLDSNPATRVKYLYDAVGMTPAGMNFAGGGFDYGDWGDIWFVRKARHDVRGHVRRRVVHRPARQTALRPVATVATEQGNCNDRIVEP